MAADIVINKKWRRVRAGSLVRWTTPAFVKRGVVTFKGEVSMRVWIWGDDKETVIPFAKDYWNPHSDYNMVELEQKKTTFVTAPGAEDSVINQVLDKLSVDEVANVLGTDAKNVRRKLRSGKIKGHREGGHWYVMRKDLP